MSTVMSAVLSTVEYSDEYSTYYSCEYSHEYSDQYSRTQWVERVEDITIVYEGIKIVNEETHTHTLYTNHRASDEYEHSDKYEWCIQSRPSTHSQCDRRSLMRSYTQWLIQWWV
jgi:hypothetical protein